VSAFLLAAFLLAALLLLSALPFGALAEPQQAPADMLSERIEALFTFRRTHDTGAAGSILGSSAYINGASSTGTDWIAIAMGRYSVVDANGVPQFLFDDGNGYALYADAIKADMQSKYNSNDGKLDNNKLTEWARATVALKSIGGDPANAGTYNGSPIDLIADGTYNAVISPLRQGFNGPVWALIAKNTAAYEQPETVTYSDEYFISYILSVQLKDGADGAYGGWALSGSASDPDMSGMAIQALAPYYNDDTVYSYTNTKTGQALQKTARQAVNEALDKLGGIQLADGDFSSWGTVNCESTVQVLTALCMVGVDPVNDPRFITSTGKTLLDGVLKYQRADGGFSHSYGFDPDNPTASGGAYNSMATDQASYALVAYWRYLNNMRSLYDCRPDFDSTARAALDNVMANIAAALAPDATPGYSEALHRALAGFRALDKANRVYVRNYAELADAITAFGGEAAVNAAVLAASLAAAKTTAKAELESYKAPADYRAEQQTDLASAVAAGKAAIDAASDVAAVNAALASSKTAIDSIKTDAQLGAEEAANTRPDGKTGNRFSDFLNWLIQLIKNIFNSLFGWIFRLF
jgi:hypothetical protein